MRYTIFAHESEYHLREELAEASPEDIKACDWNFWSYTLKQWPIAVKDMQTDMGFICIMDENLKIHKQWKRSE